MNILPRSDHYQSPPEFGIDANILQTVKLYLDTARDLEPLEIGGTCLWIQNASDLSAEIDIRFNDQLRDPLEGASLGFYIRGIPYSRVFISHTAQAGKWVTLFYAVEKEINKIEINNPSTQYNQVTISKPSTVKSTADVTIAATSTGQIVAGNAARFEAIITNLDAAETLRIGDANAGAARGQPLPPKGSLVLTVTDAIYAYNPGAAGVDVSLIETET